MRSKWVSSRVLGAALAVGLSGVIAAGCSDDDDNGNGGSGAGSGLAPGAGTGGSAASSGTGNGGASGGTGGSAASSGSSTVGGSSVGGAAMACRGLPFDSQGGEGGAETCTGVSTEAEVVPVDLYIMMDRSSSMLELVAGSTTQTRWDAIQEAVQAFVTSDNLGDTGIGIGFFSLTASTIDDVECDVDRYAEPIVPIGAVTDVGGDVVDAITTMGSRLGGLTPTTPALQGALQYAKAHQAENPGRAAVVVLVTDGFPTQCPRTGAMPSQIADAAAEGLATEPFVRTFVVGIAAGFNLDSIALAGGTNDAFEVDEANAVDSLTDALSNISNSQLACEYEMPPPPDGNTVVDPEVVQVVYTPGNDEPEEVPKIAGIGACGINPNGGWYFDDPTNPTRILVCPCTCQRFGAGRVDIRVGCRPRVGLR